MQFLVDVFKEVENYVYSLRNAHLIKKYVATRWKSRVDFVESALKRHRFELGQPAGVAQLMADDLVVRVKFWLEVMMPLNVAIDTVQSRRATLWTGTRALCRYWASLTALEDKYPQRGAYAQRHEILKAVEKEFKERAFISGRSVPVLLAAFFSGCCDFAYAAFAGATAELVQ